MPTSKSQLDKITTHRRSREPPWHTGLMSWTKLLIAVLIASGIWFAVALFSPVMTGDTSCGSMGSLVVSGGEARDIEGNLSADQLRARIDDCHAAFEQRLPTLVPPVGLAGVALVGIVVLTVKKRAARGA